MKRIALIVLLFALVPSCTLVDQAKELVKNGQALVEEGKELFKASKAEFAKAKAAADTNKDGKTSTSEWWIYLLEVLGVGGVATAAMLRNGKSNERKARTEAKLEALTERLGKVETGAPRAPTA